MGNDTALILETLATLLFSAFFSGMEIAFVSSNKLRFEMERERQSLSARVIDTFYRHPNNFISMLLVGNNIALVVYGMLMARLIAGRVLAPLGIHAAAGECPNEALCLLLETLLSTLLVLVAGEFLPKTLFKLNPNRMMSLLALPCYALYVLLWPVSKLTSSLSKALLRAAGQKVRRADTGKTFRKADLDHLVHSNIENAESGGEIEDEVKIFQNALDFSSVRVRDCIVPRTEIDAVDESATLSELKARFVESGRSKIVVRRGDIDDIAGYIHSSEMFRLGEGDDWTSRVREAPFVPETMAARKLLAAFIAEKRSLAVIVDEFGGTSGIVTLEDLVEEIFGDIEDEHDTVSYVAKKLPGGDYLLSARMEIERANEALGLDLPESDEYLTVGGLILHEYQSFPKLNEVVRFGRWEFKIVKNTTTKIELVRLKVLA